MKRRRILSALLCAVMLLALCVTGAVCLILWGLFTVAFPAASGRIDESSAITLNGTGLLMTLFVLLMLWGLVLILKKK